MRVEREEPRHTVKYVDHLRWTNKGPPTNVRRPFAGGGITSLNSH